MQYGQYPQEFIQAFKNITLSIRNQTNNTAMVWSPYSGAEYPFTWTPLTPYPGQPRFSQVDTNQDGKFDTLDDPYQPYYPGDDYVDWVGLSIFYPNKDLIAPKSHDQFQKEKPTPITTTTSPLPTSTILPPTLKFQQQSSPAGVFESQLTNTGKPFNFYNTFALAKQKPLALYTGAAFLTGQDVDADPIELQFKSSWFSQILNRSLLEKFPLIKGLLFYNAVLKVNETNYNSWFKFDKTTMADYTFTKDTKVLGYFRAKVDELSLGNVTNSSVFLRQQ